ncbi:hypothetical protein BDE02_04G112900 [Populus trichocarpa]|nr:hypothetical protein BDE02_04G112900 [Populus trichocarpa]
METPPSSIFWTRNNMLMLKHGRIEILDQNTIILKRRATIAIPHYIKKIPLMKDIFMTKKYWILFWIGSKRRKRRKAGMPTYAYY